MSTHDIQEEVDANYEVFLKMLPSILHEHRDRYALMKGGKIISYFSTAQDARTTAELLFNDGLYSIQLVTDTAINLGFFTNAVPINQIHA